MVRTYPNGQEIGLNPARIAGIAVAIMVHAAAFLLLLIPATLPSLTQHLSVPKPEFVLIPKPKPVEVQIEAAKPPPPQAERRPVTPQAPVSPPTPITVDIPAPVAESIQTDTISDTPPISEASEVAAPSNGPISASHLAYVRAPAPAYPRAAILDRAEGTVMLRVLVDVDGSPLEVTIETSSGNRELDRAARAQVLKNWKFQPAMQNGQAVQAYGRVPVNFSLR